METGACTTDKSYKTLTLDELNRVMLELKAFKKSHPLPVIMFHFIDKTSILKGKLVDLYLQCKEDEVGYMIPIACKKYLQEQYKTSFTLPYREVTFSSLAQNMVMDRLDEGDVQLSEWNHLISPIA